MGHSLVTCNGTVFYMFGGYSLSRGALNDVWKFDITTESWTQLLPASDDEPGPRYTLYIYLVKKKNLFWIVSSYDLFIR